MIIRSPHDLDDLFAIVADHESNATYLGVFEALLSKMDPNRLLGSPTQQEIADKAKVNLGTARKYLQKMTDKRLIGIAPLTRRIASGLFLGKRPRGPLRGEAWFLYAINLSHEWFDRLHEVNEEATLNTRLGVGSSSPNGRHPNRQPQ